MAGLRPIITHGFGVRGQVNLINFQSMPDGVFHFLLNYIDHGIKILSSVPIVRKRASCVAYALIQIFTVYGPPMILQSDNGREFSGAAMTARERRRHVGLDPAFLDEVIAELKLLWPDCRMVRGSPRHFESNGGVKRVNQTVQQKLGAWMRDNRTVRWSVGCKIIQWQYNTQRHSTLRDIPYKLVFGQTPRVGISGLLVCPQLLDRLSTEEDLNRVCQYDGMIDRDNLVNGRMWVLMVLTHLLFIEMMPTMRFALIL